MRELNGPELAFVSGGTLMVDYGESYDAIFFDGGGWGDGGSNMCMASDYGWTASGGGSSGTGLEGAPNNIAITTFTSILAWGTGLGPVGGLVLNFGVAAAQDYYTPSTNPNGQISDWGFP